MSAPNEATAAATSGKTNRELLREEQAIARRFMGRVPWEMVAWGIGNFLLWLSLWPLVFAGVLPLWAGFVVATICCALAYLPSHEAQHSIIAAEGEKLRWLNELVGHVSTIPLVFPYRIAWITHRIHHAYSNDPDRDPDIGSQGPTWWKAAYNALRERQPMNDGMYAKTMRETDDPNRERAFLEGLVLRLVHFAVLTGCAWSGYALEAALLWWLPRHIGFTYLITFLSWAPHHPMQETGRYRDTRFWKSPVGTILSMGMEFHIIHHLYPRIPLVDTPNAWRALEPILLERGIRDDRDVAWSGPHIDPAPDAEAA
ncbi:MAG: fatty acid desaturase [bacterium]|nr:fatty acid desaturase [bacterium]